MYIYYTHIHTHTYTHIYVYIPHTCIYTHTYSHTHRHTHTHRWDSISIEYFAHGHFNMSSKRNGTTDLWRVDDPLCLFKLPKWWRWWRRWWRWWRRSHSRANKRLKTKIDVLLRDRGLFPRSGLRQEVQFLIKVEQISHVIKVTSYQPTARVTATLHSDSETQKIISILRANFGFWERKSEYTRVCVTRLHFKPAWMRKASKPTAARGIQDAGSRDRVCMLVSSSR